MLFIKWKWIILKVFICIIFMLSRLRRRKKRRSWSCHLRGGRDRRKSTSKWTGPARFTPVLFRCQLYVKAFFFKQIWRKQWDKKNHGDFMVFVLFFPLPFTKGLEKPVWNSTPVEQKEGLKVKKIFLWKMLWDKFWHRVEELFFFFHIWPRAGLISWGLTPALLEAKFSLCEVAAT